jgi:hypothetical protein
MSMPAPPAGVPRASWDAPVNRAGVMTENGTGAQTVFPDPGVAEPCCACAFRQDGRSRQLNDGLALGRHQRLIPIWPGQRDRHVVSTHGTWEIRKQRVLVHNHTVSPFRKLAPLLARHG